MEVDLSEMQVEIDIAQWETGQPVSPSEREKVDYFGVTETGSFLIRYDIQPHIVFEMIHSKLEEARERKELIRHLERRDRYLRQKLIDTYGLKER